MTTYQVANSIDSGDKWYFNDLTYSFKTSKLPYESDEDFDGTRIVSSAQKNATHMIFDYIGSLLGLTFSYTQDVGDIVISSKDMTATTIGYAYMPGGSVKNSSGDVYISSSFNDEDFLVGGMGWSTLIHEIGHALGLSHPYGIGDYYDINVSDTVMSYNDFVGYDSFNHYYDVSSFSTYQNADILTLQKYYGTDSAILNNIYDVNSFLYSQPIDGSYGVIKDNLYTIDDQGGLDTISLENLIGGHNQYLDITPLAHSIIVNNQIHHYFSLTSNTIIENIIGSNGNDTIKLNHANNEVDGLDGVDTVYITNQSISRIDVTEDNVIISNQISGLDILTNVENLFIDNILVDTSLYIRDTMMFDDYDAASSISRLYLSVFNRLADENGLVYWVDEYESNKNMTDIANSFIVSKEFKSLYGSNVSDEEYINLLYQNILYRNPDEEGLSYWMNDIQNNNVTQSELLVSFSNSEEFIALTGIYFSDNLITTL